MQETIDFIWKLNFIGVTKGLTSDRHIFKNLANCNARVLKRLTSILKTD